MLMSLDSLDFGNQWHLTVVKHSPLTTHFILCLCQIPVQEGQWNHPHRTLQHCLLPLPAVHTGLQPGLHFPSHCQPSRYSRGGLLPLPSYRHYWAGYLEPGDRGPQTHCSLPRSTDQRFVFTCLLKVWHADTQRGFRVFLGFSVKWLINRLSPNCSCRNWHSRSVNIFISQHAKMAHMDH